MDPSKIQAVRSAAMPVLYPWVRDLVRLLDAEPSDDTPRSWKHEHCMKDLFEALRASKLLEESDYEPADIDTWEFVRIFHQLSRPFLRSILLNTVGMDFYNESLKKKNYDQTYSMVEAGSVYVAAMFINDHRGGKFLTKREILDLIEILRLYKRAVECFDRCVTAGRITSATITDRERQSLQVAREVDDIWNDNKSSQLERPKLFNANRIQNLIGMFSQRCNAAGADENDVPQQQSPLMVGIADEFQKGTWSRYPDEHTGSESGADTPWSLAWSCIKYMGLPVRVVCIPMFLACKNVDVNNGEILGTILAGSMLPGRGLNCKRPVAHRKDKPIPEAMLEEIQNHVYVHGAWYTDNMRLTAMNQPLAPDNLNPSPDPSLVIKLNETRQLAKIVKEQVEDAKRAENERKIAYEEWVAEKKQNIAKAKKLRDDMEALTRRFRERRATMDEEEEEQ